MIKVTKIREISAIRLIRDSDLFPRDRLRKGKILAHLIIFIYCLIRKGGILDRLLVDSDHEKFRK
jgi:hypothetical protein